MRVGVYFRHTAPDAGGGYTFESELLDALLDSVGSTPHRFVAMGPAGELLTRAESRGLPVVRIATTGFERLVLRAPRLVEALGRALSRPGQRPSLRSQIDAVVDRASLDALWCLGPDVPSLEVPYITTVWDVQHRLQPYFPEVSADGVWGRRERFYTATLRRATFVIAGTQTGKAEIERFYGVSPERIRILPHPTPQAMLAAAPRAGEDPIRQWGLPDGYLFYPAQFWPHKNHVALVLALEILRRRGLDLTAVFVGSDKGSRAHVERLADRLGLSDRIRILGFVDRDELIALYRRALALTYVTFFGPENLPPLEAFALGCPVIASSVAGAEEQLGDAALLVDPKNEGELADAVARLHADPSLRAMLVERGRQRARRFTTADFVSEGLRLLDEFEAIRRCWPGQGPTDQRRW